VEAVVTDATNGRIRVVCTGKETHEECHLDTLAVAIDGHWRSTMGEKRPLQVSDATRRRLVLGDDAVSGGWPTFAVKCRDPICRRDFQRHGEQFGQELLEMGRSGISRLDISLLPF
jgi:hypothetical protein